MIIGERIRTIREDKKMSQGDIQERCGLLRCYLSRVENGHTVPSVETLEKLAMALGVPLYQIFYDKDEPAVPLPIALESPSEANWGLKGREANYFRRVRRAMSKVDSRDRKLLLHMATKMAKH